MRIAVLLAESAAASAAARDEADMAAEPAPPSAHERAMVAAELPRPPICEAAVTAEPSPAVAALVVYVSCRRRSGNRN